MVYDSRGYPVGPVTLAFRRIDQGWNLWDAIKSGLYQARDIAAAIFGGSV